MPVFTEHAEAVRDSRVDRVRAFPLPRPERFSTPPTPSSVETDPFGGTGEYEVVVVGAGPSGLLLTLLLARLGLSSAHLLCIDSKATTVKSGQADGLQPRTLEVLQQLGLAHEVLTEGCQMHEVGFWNPASSVTVGGSGSKRDARKVDEKGRGIARTGFARDVVVPARFPHEVTIHQGRIERILLEDLHKYSERGVTYNWSFESYESSVISSHPLTLTLRSNTTQQTTTIMTKYLIGADGAHSTVRRSMGLHLEGESSDHIWGVMDLIVTTDFPDVRKRCAIHSDTGSVMIIPRERTKEGEHLTRIYSQMDDDVPADEDEAQSDEDAKKTAAKKRREGVTLDKIMAQAKSVFYPYSFEKKDETEVDWWAAYQIGQRMTPKFMDESRRVFIVGDACHTHSPKAGQGQNVSMMDSYNLAWKLAHVIFSHSQSFVLESYESERLQNAKGLIDFDREFSSMFSGKIGAETGLTHDAFLEVFRKGSGFTSGCGIEYGSNTYVDRIIEPGLVEDGAVSKLIPGRRVVDCTLVRFCDENPYHLQDELSFTGQFRVLFLLPSTLHVAFNPAVRKILRKGLIEPVFLHPRANIELEWEDYEPWVKEEWEWKVFDGREAYKIFGVSESAGALVVVRPDGVVGAVFGWDKTDQVENYLNRVLRL